MNIEPNRLAVRRITDFAAVETLCRSIFLPSSSAHSFMFSKETRQHG